MAQDLIEGPRNTLKSCQSTLGNCQENFQVLQTVIQHNLQPSLPLLKTMAELSAPMGGHNTVFKTSGRVQAPASSTSQLVVATEQITPEEMALDPWNILPGFLRAQELAAIEKAVNSGSPRHRGSDPQASQKPINRHAHGTVTWMGHSIWWFGCISAHIPWEDARKFCAPDCAPLPACARMH